MLASRALPLAPTTARQLDPASVALNAGAFASLVIGVDLLTTSPLLGVASVGLSAAAFATLVRREWSREAPLIPLDLLRDRSFRVSAIASVCCFAGQMASTIALPFSFEHGLGLDPLTTGLCMTPWPLTVALAAPVSGRLSNRVPTAWLCAAGGLTLGAGLAPAALCLQSGGPAPLVASTMLAGLGFGLFQTPNNRNMLLSALRARSAAAGALQGSARLIGQTAGAVIMTLLFTLVPAALAPRLGLGIGALLVSAAGLVSTLRIARRRAPETTP